MLAWLPRVPIAYPGTENKTWWVLEGAALLYLHSEFPSLSFVFRKLSPGAGLGAGGGGYLSHGPGAESLGKGVLCCHRELVALSGTRGSAPTQTITQWELLAELSL